MTTRYLHTPMTYAHEKIMLGLGALISSGISMLGAILTEDEQIRYISVTLTICILVATFMALVFRTQRENMRKVIGRCGISVIGGVLGTRMLIHHFHMAGTEDLIYLMGLAAGVTIASYLVGIVFLRMVEDKAVEISNRIGAKLGLWAPDDKEED